MTPTTAADRVIFAFNRLSSEIAAARFMKAAERLRDVALKANFDPNQLRVPAGDSEGGRWTRVGLVIRVCIPVGIGRYVDAFGNKRYNATYECPGGQTFVREGYGSPPGLVRDPFQ